MCYAYSICFTFPFASKVFSKVPKRGREISVGEKQVVAILFSVRSSVLFLFMNIPIFVGDRLWEAIRLVSSSVRVFIRFVIM